MKKKLLLCVLALHFSPAAASDVNVLVHEASARVEQQVIAWRRDIHQHPELSNREFRTAKLVAEHLRSLGMEVTEKVAHTGVVGILRGGRPGPMVALRADMDALPVLEQTGLPFASKATATYQGKQVPVMHACGHDAHTAILLGAATVLAGIREHIPGAVKFIFQPAEEGAPKGEEGGARLMIKQGVLDEPDRPEAIFGLHVWPGDAGKIQYRDGPQMAASDSLEITVTGRQTHGSMPWRGIDPITISAQIITALQAIPSRYLDITKAPSVITIGSIHGGLRGNIIPDKVKMQGTIRTFDTDIREQLLERLKNTVNAISESAGAKAEVAIRPYAPVVNNHADLAARMRPSLERAAGKDMVSDLHLIMGAEDFAYYVREIPGLYVFLGVRGEDQSADSVPANHSPLFFVNEDALITGVRAMANLALDYLHKPLKKSP